VLSQLFAAALCNLSATILIVLIRCVGRNQVANCRKWDSTIILWVVDQNGA